MRTTNGRTSGKVRFWLESYIKRLNHKTKYPESAKQESLFELFQGCLQQQITNGMDYNYCLSGIILLGLIPTCTVSARTLGNWFLEDFKDTAVCPHKTDYCPECFEYRTSMKSLKQKIDLFRVCHINNITIYHISETRR